MHEYFPKHLLVGRARIKENKVAKKEIGSGDWRLNTERSITSTKKGSPDILVIARA